jgi:hypothetical protein
MNIALRLLCFLVLLAGVTAALLFFVQGGYGGGHGRFDRAIGLLGFPWVLIPWPDTFFKVDFVALVLLPFIINAGFLAILAALRRRRLAGE